VSVVRLLNLLFCFKVVKTSAESVSKMSDKARRDLFKKTSGSEFRKRAKERDEREGSLLKKSLNLNRFSVVF
jgi:hypothetical protein